MSILPYNLVAEGSALESTSSDVAFSQCPAANAASVIPACTGDEGGTGGGILSGTHLGVCEFFEVKTSVQINGKPGVGQTMLSWMNGRNTIGVNKDTSAAAGLAGDALSAASEALKALADTINKNLAASKEAVKHFDADGHWAGKASLAKGGGKLLGPMGWAADVLSIGTAENPEVEAMKTALEAAAVAGLVLLGVGALPATLVVIAVKHAAEQGYNKIEAAEKERRKRVVACTDNNPANANACSRAYGYPPVYHPVPRFGW